MILLAWLLILSRPMLAFGAEQRGYSSQGSSTNSSNSSGSGYSYGGTNSSSGQNAAPSSSATAQEAPAEITGGSFHSARYEAERSASVGSDASSNELKAVGNKDRPATTEQPIGSNTSPHGPKDRPATAEQTAEPAPGPLSLADAWDNYQTVLGIYLAQNGAGGFWTPTDPETDKTLRLKLLRVDKGSFSETAPGRYTARVLFQDKAGKTIREAAITADLSGPAWQVSQADLKSAPGKP